MLDNANLMVAVLQKKHLPWQVFFLVCMIAFYLWLVWPSLSGGFVLDDWSNLERLAEVKQTGNIWPYTLSGIASHLGRPLAYFSFALQAKDWPDNPLSFKLTNLFIHSINALILFGICRLLGKVAGLSVNKANWLALLSSFFWLVLPVHASSVFYVVQRMTLLSGLFTLIGVFSFLYGWILSFKNSRGWVGFLVATVGMVIGYLGGVLSKENGVLLGAFVCSCYWLIYRLPVTDQSIPSPDAVFNKRIRRLELFWRMWIVLCGLSPLLLTAIYLIWGNRYLSGYGIRDYSPGERLMTEVVVLWHYVKNIMLPTPSGLNIFNDGFPVMRHFWGQPLIATAAWTLLLALGWKARKSVPFLLFGLLWFLGGHLLESTILGLELYFEHRNYIPSIGLVVAALYSSTYLLEKRKIGCSALVSAERNKDIKIKFKPYIFCLLTLMGLACSIVLRIEANSWSDNRNFIQAGLVDRPDSMRARQEAVSYYVNQGDIPMAAGLLHSIETQWPGYLGTTVGKLLLHCIDENVVINPIADMARQLAVGEFDHGIGPNLYQIMSVKKQGGCQDLSWDQYRKLIDAVLQNPNSTKTLRENAIVLLAYSYNAQMNFVSAADALDKMNESKADIDFLLLKAKFLVMANKNAEALSLLDEVQSHRMLKFRNKMAHQKQVNHLKAMIQEHIASKGESP